jgi:hypothetical protein
VIRLDSAFVANAARIEVPGGLVSALGAWVTEVAGPEPPVRQQLTFVARLWMDRDDIEAAHTFTVLVEHSDGSEVVAQAQLAVPPPPSIEVGQFDPDLPIGVPIFMPMALEFRRPGLYYFRLRVDGDELWSSPLKVHTALPQM